MQNEELIKAAWAEADCKRFYEKYHDCHGCPMPHKENPSYQRMCVDFDEEVLPQLADALEAADKRVKELDAAQRWIPCAERLPEYDPSKGANAYWIAKKTRNGEWQMKIALYSDYGYAASVDIASNVTWRDYDFCQIMNVTNWMPLPEPPRKDDEV